ncbi:hypothetical protein BG003_010310 [Podila horticola]|nr:hypothetical protein BG003_010310 [Podila horticola]
MHSGLASAAAITAIAPSSSSSPIYTAAVKNLIRLGTDAVALSLLCFLECDPTHRAGRAAATAHVRTREALGELERNLRNMLVEAVMVDPAQARDGSKGQAVALVLVQLKGELARMFGL